MLSLPRLTALGAALALAAAVAAPTAQAAVLPLQHASTGIADTPNDGVVAPGDALSISETVTNTGATPITGLQATLTSSTTGVQIVQGTASYPDLAAGASAANTTPFKVSLPPTLPCGTTVNFSLSFTSPAGTATVNLAVATGVTGPLQDHAGNPAVIGDALPTLRANLAAMSYSATAPVGATGIVKAVQVNIGHLTHDNIGDLKIDLIAPDGTRVTLINHRGAAGQAFTDTELASAGPSLTGGSAPFTGTFQADGDLSALVGTSQQGTWRLAIDENDPTEIGHLDSWTLRTATADCSPRSFADLRVPDRVDPGANATLDASHSVSVAPGGITQYEWDLGSGTFTQTTTAPTDTLTSAFAQGHYTVRVRVSDAGGVIGIATKALVVSQPPVASIAALASQPREDVDVALDGSGSTDPDGGLTSYAWDLDYDGTQFTADATGAQPTVQFSTAGAHTLALRVTDVDGATAIATMPITVIPTLAPSVSITATPNPAVVGLPVIFDASGSSDSDGTIAAYAWDLDGNGSFETSTGTSTVAAKSYPNPGVVSVGLRVTDNDGKTAVAHVGVLVKAAGGGPAPGSSGGDGSPGSTPGTGPGGTGGGDSGAAASRLAAALAGSPIQALKLVTKKGLGLRCTADRAVTCRITATLQPRDARRLGLSRSRKKAYVLGSASVRLKKAGVATITVRVSRRVLAKLKQTPRVTVLVTGTATDGGGGHASLRRAILVRR
jgi:subtilisin-like proprotein convertase family protein